MSGMNCEVNTVSTALHITKTPKQRRKLSVSESQTNNIDSQSSSYRTISESFPDGEIIEVNGETNFPSTVGFVKSYATFNADMSNSEVNSVNEALNTSELDEHGVKDNNTVISHVIESQLKPITDHHANQDNDLIDSETPTENNKSDMGNGGNDNSSFEHHSEVDVGFNKQSSSMVDERYFVSTSVENLYENGKLFAQLSQSNERVHSSQDLNRIVHVQYKPKKPKRSLQFDHKKVQIDKTSASLNDITETGVNLQNALNVRIDSENNVYISKEDFDAFVDREKNKYSGVVPNNSSFCLDEDEAPNLTSNEKETFLERETFLGSTVLLSQQKSTTCLNGFEKPGGPHSDDNQDVSVRSDSNRFSKESVKIKKIGAVLDLQIGQLERLLSTQSPSPSLEDLIEEKLTDIIEQKVSKDDSIIQSTNFFQPSDEQQNYVVHSHALKQLPDIPEDEIHENNFRYRLRRIRQSVKTARKRVIAKSGRTVNLPLISKSFRLPRKPKTINQFQRWCSSYRRRPEDGLSSQIVSPKEANVVRRNNIYGRHGDNRTSKMLGIEYEKLRLELEAEKTQIEEERHRLSQLKRQAAEKAELEWIEKKREVERRETEEKEIESKKEMLEKLKREQESQAIKERERLNEETEKMRKHEELLKQREKELAELHKERERREELERLLETEKENENVLERTLIEEKERLSTLERNFAEERSKRLEIEKRLLEEEARNRSFAEEKKRPLDTRSNGHPSTNGTLKRRVPSYTLSIRSGQSSGNAEDINLLHHISAAGHVVDNCPVIKINRYTARGYLLKMGKSRLKISWKKRWFVFDRKLRALCYYQDERKTKSKGILYFQSIQEVYVDASVKKSPNPKTTFCVRTPQRTFVLSAPSPIAMSIWLDVIVTGKEGAFSAMTL